MVPIKHWCLRVTTYRDNEGIQSLLIRATAAARSKNLQDHRELRTPQLYYSTRHPARQAGTGNNGCPSGAWYWYRHVYGGISTHARYQTPWVPNMRVPNPAIRDRQTPTTRRRKGSCQKGRMQDIWKNRQQMVQKREP
jgi:hypothetical protein